MHPTPYLSLITVIVNTTWLMQLGKDKHLILLMFCGSIDLYLNMYRARGKLRLSLNTFFNNNKKSTYTLTVRPCLYNAGQDRICASTKGTSL